MEQTSLKFKMMEAFRFRMYFFLAVAAIMFLTLIIQLTNIQLIHGEEYELKSRLNMESNIPILASRGEIYDRNFKPDGNNAIIVSNRQSFNLTTIPAAFSDKTILEETLKRVSLIIDTSYEDIEENIKTSNPWEKSVIKEDVQFDTIVKIASHKELFPNIEWEDKPVRVYNMDNTFCHVVGYVGSISRDEYKKLKKSGYRYYQKIGKSGLEKQYDVELRGADGFIRRIVDVRNRIEGEEIGYRPVAGSNLVLTIDAEIQQAAYEAMKNLQGAVVVMKPDTGEILALVSKPDFNPNLVISNDNYEIVRDLTNNKGRPFINKAIQSRYPPASTFKLITAIAALEEDKWKPHWSYQCVGKYILKGFIDRKVYCFKVHNSLDMYGALAKSCCVYFYQLGYEIGPSIILKYARYMGLNEKTGIDIPGEVPGFVPSKEWKLKTFGQPWYDGDTVNLSIGQGFISTTVIGLTNFICGIVNNGIVYRPHIVKEIRSNDNAKIMKKYTQEKIREIPLSPRTISTVKQGMRLAVKNGTAMRLNYLKPGIAAKTGTAQTRSGRKSDSTQHAWVVSYIPYNGDIERSAVVTVFVEYGVAGAVSAVPVAEKIYHKMISMGYF